jgi:phospholipase/carboxylesterase
MEPQMEFKRYEGEALRYLAIEPDGYDPEQRYPLVILLHGFGAQMGDLAGVCSAIDTRAYLYALPNAPVRIQVGPGLVGYGWTSDPFRDSDGELDMAADKLAAFFREVMGRYNVEPGGVVLGGFSQGGVMTYRCGLLDPQTFGGLVALSAMIPDPDTLRTQLPATHSQPVFVAHGTLDTVIPVQKGRQARDFLEASGHHPVEYREYEMAHEITQDVLVDLARWLRCVLPPGELPVSNLP